jgi:hypothetical protein
MFVSVLHIIIDFGVGLFDLHGTLSVTEAATLVGVALIQLWWAISFMAGARGKPLVVEHGRYKFALGTDGRCAAALAESHEAEQVRVVVPDQRRAVVTRSG